MFSFRNRWFSSKSLISLLDLKEQFSTSLCFQEIHRSMAAIKGKDLSTYREWWKRTKFWQTPQKTSKNLIKSHIKEYCILPTTVIRILASFSVKEICMYTVKSVDCSLLKVSWGLCKNKSINRWWSRKRNTIIWVGNSIPNQLTIWLFLNYAAFLQ